MAFTPVQDNEIDIGGGFKPVSDSEIDLSPQTGGRSFVDNMTRPDAPVADAQQVKDENKAKSWYQRFAEALPRGAEHGTLGLMQSTDVDKALSQYGKTGSIPYSLMTWKYPQIATPDINQNSSDLAKNLNLRGKGTGVVGALGESVIDPRFAAMLPFAPETWMGRGAMGALAGVSNPVESTDAGGRAIERTKNAAGNAAAFIAIPPAIEKGVQGLGWAGNKIADMAGFGGEEAAPSAYNKVADTLVNQEGKTPQQIMDAAVGMKDAAAKVAANPEETASTVPLTFPEAVESENLLKKQRVLGELSNEAGNSFTNFNKKRLEETLPEAKENLVNEVGDGTPLTMTDAGNKVKTLADNIIQNTIKTRTEALQPQYKAIENTPLPQEAILQLRSNPAIEEIYQNVLKDPAVRGQKYNFKPALPEGSGISQDVFDSLAPDAQKQVLDKLGGKMAYTKTLEGGLPEDSVGLWNQVKSQLNRIKMGETPYPGLTNNDGRIAGSAANSIKTALEDTNINPSADIYKATNADYITKSKDIQALFESPIGKIAKAGNGEAATKMIMNMSREQLAQLINPIREENPEIVKDIGGSILREATDKTSDSGIKTYINALSKNDIVRDRMQAILGDDGFKAQQELVGQLEKILPGLPRNSETASKIQILQDINEGNPVKQVQEFAESPKAYAVKQAWNWLTNKVMASDKKQSDLMNIFLDPDLDKLGKALEGLNQVQKKNAVLEWIGQRVAGVTGNQISNAPAQASPSNSPKVQVPPPVGPNLQKPPQVKPQANAAPANMKDLINPIAQSFGNDTDTLHKIAMAESGGNPNAQNPNSTARGLYQFTTPTWKAMIDKYGKQLGLSYRDRMDPVANTIMANALMQENKGTLKGTLGREPNGTELYLAHFLGAHGASKILSNMEDVKVSAARLLPEAAQSNPHVFFENGQPITPKQLYQKVESRLNGV